MAKKHNRETHEKRAREHSKQVSRRAKQAERVERNARKREARDAGTGAVPPSRDAEGITLDDPRHPAYVPAGAPREQP
jgi:hypothetical protein